MPDEQVGEINPVFARHDFYQSLLDLFGRCLAGEPQPTGKARDVCIHDDTFGLAVSDSENDIGGFAADAVKQDQFVKGVGDFPAVFLDQALAAVADGAGLVAEEAGAANHGLEFGGGCGSEIGSLAVTLKQRRGDEINSLVGALCAEDGRDEELQRIVVAQGAARAGVGGTQAAEDRTAARQQFALGNAHGSQYSIATKTHSVSPPLFQRRRGEIEYGPHCG